MKTFPIHSDRASLALTETGGHLSDVTFILDGGRRVSPMHAAPWSPDEVAAGTEPLLRVLRGDFFCAPFGANDVAPGEKRTHGATANGQWRLEQSGDGWIDAVLDDKVAGATVTKHIALRSGHVMVYQHHTFAGGSGRLPLGHHAMLRADPPIRIAVSPRLWAGTPPDAIETPPAGRSVLAYPQEIGDLTRARLADGGAADLTRYPFAEGHEDIWGLVSDPSLRFAWSAATSAEAGWVWFALKNPRVLPMTLFWLSNGGRTYAPWRSRHVHCIGIEEICGYFHLGHAASIAENPFTEKSIPTAVELRPDAPWSVSYAFGLAAVPPSFGPVTEVRAAPGGVIIADAEGHEIFAPCDPGFVADSPD
jgi:hypothetical protein